jgi:hypothetical protein
MKLLEVTVAFTLALFAIASSAQGVESLADMRKITDSVLSTVAGDRIEAGLNSFKSRTIIPSAEFDAMVGQAVTQWPVATARFGKSVGYEFIREDKLGEFLARSIYIQRFEKHAVRWMFYLYRGQNGWVINTFRFDDKWPELFVNP